MMDLSQVLYNPAFSQDFFVHRFTGHEQAGRWTMDNETVLPFTGVIMPANEKEIMQLLEADRTTGTMIFYSDQEMFLTRHADIGETFQAGTSDEIEWKGDKYRVNKVNQFGDYGWYAAYAGYMEGY